MTWFVLRRARAHVLLLTAALLTVLLATSVLTALTAFSGAIGDAALRQTLRTRDASGSALVVRAQVPDWGRDAADAAVRRNARRTFDGLPVTVRSLISSGPYALPRSLQLPAARSGDPDLTRFAALAADRIRIIGGRAPRASSGGTTTAGAARAAGGVAETAGRTVEVALPETAARRLRLHTGSTLTLTDRLDGPAVHVRVTGLYRPLQPADPYWRLDDLGGRGAQQGTFTAYGPLLDARSVLTGGRVSAGRTGWLATADFSALTTGRVDRLRAAAREGPKRLVQSPVLGGSTDVTTALPQVLDRTERALLVGDPPC